MESDALDELDRKLLHALELDGRAAFSRIATVLGVSDQTVARRYRKLRTVAGLRVLAVRNTEPPELEQWLLRLRCTPEGALTIAEALARRPDTSWIALAAAGTEVLCTTRPRNRDESDELLLGKLPRTPHIVEIRAHQLLHRFFGGPDGWFSKQGALTPEETAALRPERRPTPSGPEPRATPGNPERRAASSGPEQRAASSRPEQRPTPARPEQRAAPTAPDRTATEPDRRDPPPAAITEDDAPLLAALARDGRATYPELQQATGRSESVLKRRLTQLLDSGALYLDTEYHTERLGHRTVATLIITAAPAALNAVGAALAAHPEIACVFATSGPTNLTAVAVTRDTAHLYRYLSGVLGPLAGIEHVETLPVQRRVKQLTYRHLGG